MSLPRRNGQLSSCEPCRKSKLRCDHAAPICTRCAQRNRSDQCVYHPAPMTRPRDSPKPMKATKKKSTAQMLVPAKSSAVWTGPSSVTLLASAQFPNSSKRPFSGTGFLGPTSYSGAFSAGVDAEPADQTALVKSTLVKSTPIDPQQVSRGAQVLFLLENLPLYDEIIEKRFSIAPGWVLGPPVVRGLVKTIRQIYRNATEGSENKYARLADLSRVFFRNTATPIETHGSMSFEEYLIVVAPRWEVVSVILAFVGAATYQVPQHDLGLKQEKDGGSETSKEGLRQIAFQGSEACLAFCSSLGTISDPLVWAMVQHTVFSFWMHGTSDHRTWQTLGDITTTVFALGLHQPDTDSKIPFFLSEIRKRTMVGAYALDKDIATFLGRPPRICWRYCNIPYPLDMSYEEIVAEPAIRDMAMQRLDSNGWNIDGSLNKGARARGNLIVNINRENVLEVSLSHRNDRLEERIQAVCKTADEMRSTLPPFLQWTDATEDSDVASLHLDFLYQEFLLLQTLFKRTGNGRDALISKSSEVITILLQMVTMETRSGQVHPSIIADLCYAGLPAAGVLSTELLRRSQPQAHLDPSIPATPFPRSEVIQSLSVFLSQLNTFLNKQQGDYEICVKGQKVISQVLDRVLAPAPAPYEAPVPGGLLPENTVLGEDMEFMAFLENFDWEQEMRLTFG
ncbi:chromatin structure remodeling complex protein RSC3 [Aspergillus ellipticus CBS 707.79]|uniref:Chromatin structure remodeling complex protein RSC3 n=1 Tax=Aspergillus ellipticus CBS 707.79 TaxID=1448320 RepID=A0A319E074_9EURO|nr:chromatin structure remodeling complex protein RSC3 [Aspergillus ellipticus CBS 707.79]